MRTGSKTWLSSASTVGASNGRTAAGRAEGSVAHVPAGAAGNLREFRVVEPAKAEPVEFLVRRERHMVDVEIESHADRIGRHQIIHVTGLIELDLGIAGPRGEGSQHHRRAATLAADELGDGVDLLGRERHDGGAAGKARHLLLAREGKLREARPCHHMDARHQRLDERAHGVRPDQQGLVAPALIEQAVGEDVSAVEIARQLHLVDGDEGQIEIARHRLDG